MSVLHRMVSILVVLYIFGSIVIFLKKIITCKKSFDYIKDTLRRNSMDINCSDRVLAKEDAAFRAFSLPTSLCEAS